MKKHIKLGMTTLRRLVEEYSPKNVNKFSGDHGLAIGNFVDAVTDTWRDMDDGGDPSINATSPDAWEEQVDKASAELDEELWQLVSRIEEKLVNGDYHAPKPAPRRSGPPKSKFGRSTMPGGTVRLTRTRSH